VLAARNDLERTDLCTLRAVTACLKHRGVSIDSLNASSLTEKKKTDRFACLSSSKGHSYVSDASTGIAYPPGVEPGESG